MSGNLDFLFTSETNRSYGAGITSRLGELLWEEVPNFGTAIHEINLNLAVNGQVQTVNDEVSKLIRGADWIPNWIPIFPNSTAFEPLVKEATVRFERKRELLRITWPSTRLTPDEASTPLDRLITRDLFYRVFDDVIDGLSWAFQKRIKPSDDFDAVGCLAWLQKMRAVQYPSDEELNARLASANDAYQAFWATRSPWEQLSVDWDRMHADAREILNDPFYWSEGHEFSPHGNDAGADILADWSQFKKMPVAEVCAAMGLPRSAEDMPDYLWKEWIDVHLALAFGHIKKSGNCPANIAKVTREVICKEQRLAQEKDDWEHRDEWLQRLSEYDQILRPYDQN